MFNASYDNPHLGSDHGDDLDAFFSPPPSDANADDVSLFEAMREYWTSFVTSGVPTTKSGLVWEVGYPVSCRLILLNISCSPWQMKEVRLECSFIPEVLLWSR